MAFDPTLPANSALVSAPELRSQFNGLKQLIDDIPDGPSEAQMALLAQLLANVSFNGDNMFVALNGLAVNNGLCYLGDFGEGNFVALQCSDDGERVLAVSNPLRMPSFRTESQDVLLSNGPNTMVYVDYGFTRVASPDLPFSISGLINTIPGKQITLHNVVADIGSTMTLKHDDPDEPTEFVRILCPGRVDLVCETATLIYDDTLQRWVVVSYTN